MSDSFRRLRRNYAFSDDSDDSDDCPDCGGKKITIDDIVYTNNGDGTVSFTFQFSDGSVEGPYDVTVNVLLKNDCCPDCGGKRIAIDDVVYTIRGDGTFSFAFQLSDGSVDGPYDVTVNGLLKSDNNCEFAELGREKLQHELRIRTINEKLQYLSEEKSIKRMKEVIKNGDLEVCEVTDVAGARYNQSFMKYGPGPNFDLETMAEDLSWLSIQRHLPLQDRKKIFQQWLNYENTVKDKSLFSPQE